MHKVVTTLTVAAVTGVALLSFATDASAQPAGNVQYVTPTAKGIAGCALLGAEAVALVEAAAGVQARWAYIVGPLLGAGAGAVGGYFLEQAGNGGTDTTLTGLAVGSLVLGLGLVIPTVVAYVNATNYRPESQTSEDAAPSNVPIDESTGIPPANAPPSAQETSPSSGSSTGATGATGGTGSTASPQGGNAENSSLLPTVRVRRSVAHAQPMLRPLGLFDMSGRGLSLSVPAVSFESSVSLHEMRQYGIAPQSELRVPLFSGSF
jgi:hypothetical protein